MAFPPGLKHGTAFVATRKDLDYLFKSGRSLTKLQGFQSGQ